MKWEGKEIGGSRERKNIMKIKFEKDHKNVKSSINIFSGVKITIFYLRERKESF
jgi:hypothetical protein